MIIPFTKAFLNKFPETYSLVEHSWIIDKVYWTIDWRYRISVDLQDWIKRQITNPPEELVSFANSIPDGEDYDETVVNCLKAVNMIITYQGDKASWDVEELWQPAIQTFTLRTGDCFAGYEEIHTKQGICKIQDIKVGDEILSYDLTKKEYVYKPIIKSWSKGALQINRIHFRNGQTLDVSAEHPMWARVSQKESVYQKIPLSDINLEKWWTRKVPIAKKIPYNKSVAKYSKELYRVLGHYIAEGWYSGGKVCSSGYELSEHIIPILEDNNIPFSEYTNNSGVPCITFLKSEFKEYLRGLKQDSFNITLYEELITLPEEYLEELLYGMWIGDGTKEQYPDSRGFKNNKEWTYSTSSKQLAEDLQRIGLHLGRTFHIWRQENHKGIGTSPIYRINYNTNSRFMKDYGYDGISEVSISYIEKLEDTEMFDITVADTHTVIMKNGIITHNCEDGAILLYILCRLKGIPANRLYILAGSVVGGGHCWLGYKPIHYPLNFVFLDWCYGKNGPSMNKVLDRDFYHINGTDITGDDSYIELWFAFNEDQGVKSMSKRTLKI